PYILIGHSMGGLNLSLYAAHRPDSHFDAIILNSPFLEMNFNWAVRNLALPVVSGLGRLFPNVALPGTGDPNYANSLYKSRKGEWDFDTTLKTFARPKQYLGWVRGVHLGHNKIKEGLHIKAPILVMHSDCSIDSKEWVEEFTHCDGVLNHEQIAEQAPNLGENVTTVTIPDGLHDLYLSPKPVRDKAYDETFRFIDKNLRK
ncbi:MAG: alpha/beta fold hydrolase, partial [Fibrobacter sp.]|nr:alpha/beta fold hydrolase [Fibrobacter sp.]